MADARMDQERRLEIGARRRAKTRAAIIAAAFEIFGEGAGLFARVEDIAVRAGITRATFYSHFTGMADVREALTFEITHDFLAAVTATVSRLDDPRERASAAVRFYLRRVGEDPRWGWSMVNLSANGVIFGAETHRQAEVTVSEGIAAGLIGITSSAAGRDLVLGTTLAAMATLLREDCAADYPELIAAAVLAGLGVEAGSAASIARRPLPQLAP